MKFSKTSMLLKIEDSLKKRRTTCKNLLMNFFEKYLRNMILSFCGLFEGQLIYIYKIYFCKKNPAIRSKIFSEKLNVFKRKF